jgi:hypothetical protein
MLKTPARFINDPILSLVALSGGRSGRTTILGDGMVQIGHFSSDIMLYGRNGDWSFEIEGVPTYGVCDSPEQFMEKFGDAVKTDPRNCCVFFTHIAKDTGNKHHGGGWRWHKWGEYIGDGKPEREYLDDEDGFDDGVFVFHIHDIDWKP